MSSEVVDLHICICIHTSHWLYLCMHRLRAAEVLPWPAAPPPTHFSSCVDLFSPLCYCMTRNNVTAAVFKLGARFLDTFQVRHCLSAVNLGKMLSSEFVQCVLWVIRLTKTVESVCCAVRHICDTAESCLTNDMLTTFSSSADCYDDWRRPSAARHRPSAARHRPSAACPTMPAVHSVGVIYYAVVTMHLLLSACC